MYGLHSGTELVAGRAPKIGVERTHGLPHPGLRDSGTSVPPGEKAVPRRVASDPLDDFDTNFLMGDNDGGSDFFK